MLIDLKEEKIAIPLNITAIHPFHSYQTISRTTFAASKKGLMKYFYSLVLACMVLFGNAQNKVTLSGYVKDGETGEGMISATVLVKELTQGVSTNEYGFYSLTLEPGTYTFEWSFVPR